MDQASGLRERLSQRNENITVPPMTARVITVTSGKGGVGKTNFAVNLAIHLTQRQKRVVIIDADFGLANIEVLFGIVPKNSLADVFLGNRSVEDVITEGPLGIKFISGGSGFKELANITDKQMNYLVKNFAYLDTIADIIIIDTGAGISNSVINFVRASDESIIITTPEPTSITDAYALIKTMKEEKSNIPEFKIVINRVEDQREGSDIFNKLNMVSKKFLSIPLYHLGSISHDPFLIKAVKKQQPVLLLYPNCSFAKSVEFIGDKLVSFGEISMSQQPGILSFMKRLVNIFGN